MRKYVALIFVLVLAACGQNDPPTNEQLQEVLNDPDSYFEITRPDGSQMWCVQYGSRNSGSQQSFSWFSFTCDWAGDYDPNELG